MKKIITSITIVVLGTFMACNSRSVGNEKLLLTKKQLVVDLVSMIIPEINSQETTCVSSIPDVEDNSTLCRALELLETRGIDMTSPDGNFNPNDFVLNAEMWSYQVKILGFLPFNSALCASDVEPTSWYALFAGALCRKGLMQSSPDGMANPSAETTLEDWETQKHLLTVYLQGATTRMDSLEQIQSTILEAQLRTSEACTSNFSDVSGNSFECYLSNSMLDEGLLDSSQENLRPENHITWDENVKLMLDAAGIQPASQCTGCMSNPQVWSCGYMDKLCELNLNLSFIVSGEEMVRFGFLRFTWLLTTHLP